MKRTYLRPKSAKRPAWENLPLRYAYRDANAWCELSQHLVGLVPGIGKREAASEVHHIICGNPRWDLTTNLISLCRPVHRWMHANERDGRVLALHVKMHKGELDWSEFETASGYKRTVVLNWRPTNESFLPAWRELRVAVEE